MFCKYLVSSLGLWCQLDQADLCVVFVWMNCLLVTEGYWSHTLSVCEDQYVIEGVVVFWFGFWFCLFDSLDIESYQWLFCCWCVCVLFPLLICWSGVVYSLWDFLEGMGLRWPQFGDFFSSTFCRAGVVGRFLLKFGSIMECLSPSTMIESFCWV